MTKQELNDLYDSLYYGHDVELKINERHYFIEWSNVGIDIYDIIEDTGTKIETISCDEKCNILSKLFEYRFDEKTDLNSSYADIEIIDIE